MSPEYPKIEITNSNSLTFKKPQTTAEYTPEVDKDGFDMIFDDQDILAKVQLKTVMKKATTNSWQIHKSLLRPFSNVCEDLGFESSPTGCGYQGGVILIELYDGAEGFNVNYYYTDIIILCGIRDKIITLKENPSEKAINTFLKSVMDGVSNERVNIYKNMFLKANSPGALLALMGLHNNINTTVWRYHIQKMAEPYIDQELAAPYEVLKQEINNEIKKLSSSISTYQPSCSA